MSKSPTAIAFEEGIHEDVKQLHLCNLKGVMKGQEPDWDEVVTLLGNWIQGYSNTNKASMVFLHCNNLGDKAADLFSVIIGKVDDIHLDHNRIGNEGAARIAQSLQDAFNPEIDTSNTEVNLEDNMIGNKGMLSLVPAIQNYNESNGNGYLARFFLGRNMFDERGLINAWQEFGSYITNSRINGDEYIQDHDYEYALKVLSQGAIKETLATQKRLIPCSALDLEPELSGMFNKIQLLGIVAEFEAATTPISDDY